MFELHELVSLQNEKLQEDQSAYGIIILPPRERPPAAPVLRPENRIDLNRSCWSSLLQANESIGTSAYNTNQAYGHERDELTRLPRRCFDFRRSGQHATFAAKLQSAKCSYDSRQLHSLPLPSAMLPRPNDGLQAPSSSRRGGPERVEWTP